MSQTAGIRSPRASATIPQLTAPASATALQIAIDRARTRRAGRSSAVMSVSS